MFSSFAGAESGEFEEFNVENLESAVHDNVAVSPTIPVEINSGEITLFSSSTPTSAWNLATKGIYNFSGSAQISNLYSNYLFIGKSTVNIRLINHYSSTLTVKLIAIDAWFNSATWTKELKSGYSSSSFVNVDPNKKYYLLFYAPSNFSGSIQ